MRILMIMAVLLMAAAVADFRPDQAAQQKIKKQRALPVLALQPTDDILAAVYRELSQFTKGRKSEDDITLVVIKVNRFT